MIKINILNDLDLKIKPIKWLLAHSHYCHWFLLFVAKLRGLGNTIAQFGDFITSHIEWHNIIFTNTILKKILIYSLSVGSWPRDLLIWAVLSPAWSWGSRYTTANSRIHSNPTWQAHLCQLMQLCTYTHNI